MNNIDKITLQYLLNPNIFDKINNSKEENIGDLENYSKYKTKILELTESMFNNNFINNQIKEDFNNYCKNLIYYIRNQEIQNIVQNEYKDMKIKQKKFTSLIDTSNNNFNDVSLNINHVLNKVKKPNDLNSFIIKNNKNDKNNKINKDNINNKFLPKKKNLDHI